MCEFSSMKKMKIGICLFFLGLLWYLNEMNIFIIYPFWPIIVMLAGVLVVLKGAMMSGKPAPRPAPRRRR